MHDKGDNDDDDNDDVFPNTRSRIPCSLVRPHTNTCTHKHIHTRYIFRPICIYVTNFPMNLAKRQNHTSNYTMTSLFVVVVLRKNIRSRYYCDQRHEMRMRVKARERGREKHTTFSTVIFTYAKCRVAGSLSYIFTVVCTFHTQIQAAKQTNKHWLFFHSPAPLIVTKICEIKQLAQPSIFCPPIKLNWFHLCISRRVKVICTLKYFVYDMPHNIPQKISPPIFFLFQQLLMKIWIPSKELQIFSVTIFSQQASCLYICCFFAPWMQISYKKTPSHRSGTKSGRYNSMRKNIKSGT